jgi:oligopeptidase B
MATIRDTVLIGLIIVLPSCASPNSGPANSGAGKPPVAEKRPKTVAGPRVDDYFWLRDKNDPATMAYLKAEDGYADAMMKPTAGLQDTLFKEMVGHIKETDSSAPYPRGDYFYYTRTVAGEQYPIYCRKRGSVDQPEQALLDLNEMAKGKPFMAVGAFEPSDDGTLLAYTTDEVGYRQYTLHVRNLTTGQVLPDTAERVDDLAWATDNKTILYVTEDAVTKRNDKLFRHVLGAPSSELVYAEPDELFDMAVGRSRDAAMILLQIAAKTSTEFRYLPAGRPTTALKIILPREPGHEYDVDHRGDVFYIRTNKGAKNFRVVSAPVADPSEKHWTEVVAHKPEVKIDAVDAFADHLVLSEWEGGLQQIEVLDLPSGTRHRVTFPEPVYTAVLAQNYVFKSNVVRYNYTSLVSPPSVFDYDMTTHQSHLIKETEVPNFDKSNYTSERVFATASDGTKVPIALVSKRGVLRDGSAPLLMYGYGSYGFSTPPTFAASRLALLDRGVVYAIAQIRGGGELGEPWRDAGRMMNKINTFTDFIACAEYLVAQTYTSTQRLVIQGGSAGGLLVAASANMRPDLFKAVIAQVPFVDVLNSMLDASLPLTTSEYIEWGNPNEKAAYDYMARYSPYDNIKAQAYPAMLVKISVNDSQVGYWEGAKFTAKLRAMKTDTNPLLLKVNFGAGHGGSSGRYDALHETAFNWAFVLWQVGLAKR